MNLSPECLASEGLEAVHWSSVGVSSASDKGLMAWAKSGEHIVLTHDLDFGAILAATNADGQVLSSCASRIWLPHMQHSLLSKCCTIISESLSRAPSLPPPMRSAPWSPPNMSAWRLLKSSEIADRKVSNPSGHSIVKGSNERENLGSN
ncbi:MAG: DUF5615 family PIN-like protein [Chloroflexota bacterium]